MRSSNLLNIVAISILVGVLPSTVRAADVSMPSGSAPSGSAPGGSAPSGSAPSGSPTQGPAAPATLPHRTALYVGFGHWYSDVFGAPIGAHTPAIGLGYTVAPWLESRVRYSASLVKLPLHVAHQSHVGFASLELLLGRELRTEGQRARMSLGPLVGFVHTGDGLGAALGGDISARYLLDAGQRISLGPYIDVRALSYRLPRGSRPDDEGNDSSSTGTYSDIQIDLGVAVNLW